MGVSGTGPLSPRGSYRKMLLQNYFQGSVRALPCREDGSGLKKLSGITFGALARISGMSPGCLPNELVIELFWQSLRQGRNEICWSRGSAERIWGEFLILVWRIFRTLPANVLANSSANLFREFVSLVSSGFQGPSQKIHARNSLPKLSTFLFNFAFLNPFLYWCRFSLGGRFRYYLFFSSRGGGRGSPRCQGGEVRSFIENPRGGSPGGRAWRGQGAGRVSAAKWGGA